MGFRGGNPFIFSISVTPFNFHTSVEEEGRFVQFDPIRAIKENTPKVRKLVMSAEEYYRRYGTQTNQEGWVRTFLEDRQETIYVKQILN